MVEIGWYARRLRAMSMGEMGWRAARALTGAVPQPFRSATGPDLDFDAALAGFRAVSARPLLLSRDRIKQLAFDHPEQVDALLSAARRSAEHRFAFFGYPETRLPEPVDWHYDPVADLRWPQLPAEKIDHRSLVGDVKWIWELNRLQHLPWLAQAWLLTGEEQFAEAALADLDSWLVQNPPGHGIAWRGAFEAGIRAVSITLALQGLKDAPGLTIDRFRRVVTMLSASAERCWRDRSLYSSANNHLVGELAGLAVIALLLPELPQAAVWERRAVAGLVTQADRQILPDGMGAEQAVGYQIFTAELIALVADLLRRRDGAAPTALMDAVGRGARFLAAVVGEADPAPRFGDDDEGFALRLGAEDVRTVRQHLQIAGEALGDAGLIALGEPSLTAGWLATDRPPAEVSSIPRNFYAADGGLVVLRRADCRLLLDVGPLGFLQIAAHGHADALSLNLSLAGTEVITDPGAGSYYGHPQRRQVHRGTRAHATVSVDGQDQSVIGGPFLWSRHARVQVRSVDLDAGVVDAEHDGYRRLDAAVTHRRWLVAPPGAEEIVVVDLLTGSGEHQATVSWPLAPGLQATERADGFEVLRAGRRLLVLQQACTAPSRLETVLADPRTNLGWWSERLESAVGAPLVGLSAIGPLPMAAVTLLRPQDGSGSVARVDELALRLDERIEVSWIDPRSGPHQVVIDPAGDGLVTLGRTPDAHRDLSPAEPVTQSWST